MTSKFIYEIVRAENGKVFCPFCHSLYIIKALLRKII